MGPKKIREAISQIQEIKINYDDILELSSLLSKALKVKPNIIEKELIKSIYKVKLINFEEIVNNIID